MAESVNKKQKVSNKGSGRNFQDWWTETYGVINKNSKALCVLCNEAIVSRTYNVKRHFDTNHQWLLKQCEQERKEYILEALKGAEELKLASSSLLRESSQLTINNEIPKACVLSLDHFFSSSEKLNSQYIPQSSENYKLQHNNHFSLILDSLTNDESFLDVTLTAQGKSIKAHKSVLSAVSSYFKGVLKQNPCQHPIIIMPRDIKYEELQNIVSFIYRGEITISAEDLSSLLKTAEVLQISGLKSSDQSDGGVSAENLIHKSPETESATSIKSKRSKDCVNPKKDTQLLSMLEQINPVDFLDQNMSTVKQEEKGVKDKNSKHFLEAFDFKSEEFETEHLELPVVESGQVKSESPPFECPHCSEVKRPLEVLESHLSSKHPTKPSFVCKNCAKVFLRQLPFQTHIKTCQPQ